MSDESPTITITSEHEWADAVRKITGRFSFHPSVRFDALVHDVPCWIAECWLFEPGGHVSSVTLFDGDEEVYSMLADDAEEFPRPLSADHEARLLEIDAHFSPPIATRREMAKQRTAMVDKVEKTLGAHLVEHFRDEDARCHKDAIQLLIEDYGLERPDVYLKIRAALCSTIAEHFGSEDPAVVLKGLQLLLRGYDDV